MGSLNNGRHIGQDSKLLRHEGWGVTMSAPHAINLSADKFAPSFSDELKKLEDSVRGISNRVLWLDASDTASVFTTTSGNFVVASGWRDKTSNGIVSEPSGLYASIRPKYKTVTMNNGSKNVLQFDGGQGFSFGQQLDSSILGTGKSWTIVSACNLANLEATDNFQEYIVKYGEDIGDNSFSTYIVDSSIPTSVVFRNEIYANGSLLNSVNVDRPISLGKNILTSVYAGTSASGSNSSRIAQNVNRENEVNSFVFGNGFLSTDIIADNHVPLAIGRKFVSNGYTGFQGDIYEIVIFSKVLTAQEIGNVENYLALKWDVTPRVSKLRQGAG